MQKKDLFAHKSKHWDAKSRRVQSAKAIADTILENISLNKEMHIMDFGAGTGLLSYCLSHKVGKVTALDNSPSMLEVFKEKSEAFECPTVVLEHDLVHENLYNNIIYDGIVSSMTMHHIEDQEDMFSKMYALLAEDGFIALADLDREDGTFHSDNEGVFHFGFDRDVLENIAKKVGFKEIKFYTANTIEKPQAIYTVFLMTAKK
ncbi:class I SAM-dependent methyltransferase [bacterium]|nr:class I SAM-dependent methyltransferase [bacterium]MBU1957200.1 class I SAM-dependent methyltransferase [bacterium]